MLGSTIRLMKSFAHLRELTNECINLLEKSDTGDTTYRALRIGERVKEIPELLKSIHYDWERVPGEWNDSVKEWNELVSLRRKINEIEGK